MIGNFSSPLIRRESIRVDRVAVEYPARVTNRQWSDTCRATQVVHISVRCLYLRRLYTKLHRCSTRALYRDPPKLRTYSAQSSAEILDKASSTRNGNKIPQFPQMPTQVLPFIFQALRKATNILHNNLHKVPSTFHTSST